MSLDHGQLNISLAKRGNIDTQIDAYKAAQLREREANGKRLRAAHNAAQDAAKAAIAAVSDARMAELGKPHGLTAKQARAQFVSMAWAQPALVTRLMEREAA